MILAIVLLAAFVPRPVPKCPVKGVECAVRWDYAWRNWVFIEKTYVFRDPRSGKCSAFLDGFRKPPKDVPCPQR